MQCVKPFPALWILGFRERFSESDPLSLSQTVSGSGSFQIHLNSLRNIKHEKSNGECCDGRRTIHHGQSVCSDECDTFFRVCLNKQNTQHDSSTGPCMYGEFTTVVLRRSSISFTNTSLSNNGFRNPISIHLSSLWKVGLCSLFLELIFEPFRRWYAAQFWGMALFLWLLELSCSILTCVRVCVRACVFVF